MRIVVAQMSHETNTFSPVITDLKRFSHGEGERAISTFRGTATCLGGYIALCEAAGAEIVLPIAAGAPPSGPVEDDAFEYIAQRIVAAAERGCDAMLLDLHGAMVTRTYADGEGELLRRIRAVAPNVPIALALDMHANLYPETVARVDVIAGYQTYPHIDMDETALRAGRALLRMLAGEVKPTMVWGNAPMLPHVMRQGTDDFPNAQLQARAREMERDGALAVSLFTGFPHADIEQAGLSVVVVTDGDRRLAEQWRDELLDQAWKERAAFVYVPEPLADSVAKAKAIGREPGATGPVILLDHYDNTASGGTMDTTEVLAEILRQGLDDVAVFGIFDPAAVQQMVEVGVGNEVTVSLGGKTPMPSVPAPEPSAHGHRSGQVDLRRQFPGDRRDVARADDADGNYRRVVGRRRRYRRDLAPHRTVRSRLLHVGGYRSDEAQIPDAEEPHPLSRRLSADRARHRRMRRRRRLHVGLFGIDLQARAAADLSARRRQYP